MVPLRLLSIYDYVLLQVPSESSVGNGSSTASSEVSRPVSLTSLGSCSSSGSSGHHQPGSAYLASAESLDSDPEPTGSQGQYWLAVCWNFKLEFNFSDRCSSKKKTLVALYFDFHIIVTDLKFVHGNNKSCNKVFCLVCITLTDDYK